MQQLIVRVRNGVDDRDDAVRAPQAVLVRVARELELVAAEVDRGRVRERLERGTDVGGSQR